MNSQLNMTKIQSQNVSHSIAVIDIRGQLRVANTFRKFYPKKRNWRYIRLSRGLGKPTHEEPEMFVVHMAQKVFKTACSYSKFTDRVTLV
jgi:hypothetical protein